MEWGRLRLEYEEQLPVGMRHGQMVIVVDPAEPSVREPVAGSDAAGTALLRVRGYSCRVVAMHCRTAVEPGAGWEDVTDTALREGERVLAYPVARRPAAGPVEYRLDWAAYPQDGAFGLHGEERLLHRVELVRPGADGEAKVLGSARAVAEWVDFDDPQVVAEALARLSRSPAVPGQLRSALAEFVEADKSSVPACVRCSLRWEFDLLTRLDRVRELTERHGCVPVADRLARWDIEPMDERIFYRPCACVRALMGSGPDRARQAAGPQDEDAQSAMRAAVAAARTRHAEYRRRADGERGSGGAYDGTRPGA
ncbi:hypothetical protein [Streptomyces sp. NPDC049040]|uniref:hypothetical protein n=1 Tax=Streptomyces sp. NPDC049040 TaxID=3365593 RepID=UPI003711341A